MNAKGPAQNKQVVPPIWQPTPSPTYTNRPPALPSANELPPEPQDPSSDLEKEVFAQQAFDCFLRHIIDAIKAYNGEVDQYQGTKKDSFYGKAKLHYERGLSKKEFKCERSTFEVKIDELKVETKNDIVIGVLLRGWTEVKAFIPKGNPGITTDGYSSSSSSSYPLVPLGFPIT